MTHYQQQISKATGVTDATTLQDIEDYMRDIYFHSTLDWQSEKQLKQGAIDSWGDIQFMRSAEGQEYMKQLNK